MSSFDVYCLLYSIFFFFSSRRRHTRCSRDWSSDVCSSDLNQPLRLIRHDDRGGVLSRSCGSSSREIGILQPFGERMSARSEERRVGKEGRSRWSPYH